MDDKVAIFVKRKVSGSHICLLCLLFLTPVRRSRPSARSKAAELKDPPAATSSLERGDTEAGVSQNSRLKELLSANGLKPRPPSTPRVREPISSSAGQTDGLTSRRKRREGHVAPRAPSAKTDGDLASPKPRNHKEKAALAAGSRALTDQAPPPSTRSCSSKTPQRNAQSATRTPSLKQERGERHLEHEQAARTIQRAWRR